MSSALFVTWKRHGSELRGCLGTFKVDYVSKLLPEYAIASAMRDSRFAPMRRDELASMNVSVSLLDNFEPADDLFDWSPGEHGISIKFAVDDRHYKATYLPEVVVEQQWQPRQALDSLIRKSGYRGRISEGLLQNIELTRYQSQKYTLSYLDYRDGNFGT